eukprot:TRINITY_DN1562_c0_g1_i8.p1 TRINITY_DN1562_c0_g1~~TRINITY_DN1562_c0_g1_i8.p1  ORF type:complete len:118 (+),score=0.66 TRINITY_DN1562_c0_g1_i8:138-491(+)
MTGLGMQASNLKEEINQHMPDLSQLQLVGSLIGAGIASDNEGNSHNRPDLPANIVRGQSEPFLVQSCPPLNACTIYAYLALLTHLVLQSFNLLKQSIFMTKMGVEIKPQNAFYRLLG